VRLFLRGLGVTVLLGFTVVGFQNCGGAFQALNSSQNLSLSSDVGSELPQLDGRALYSRNCTSCHGEIDQSTKLNRSAYSITVAIRAEVPLMSHLYILSDAEIQAIATALSRQTTPPPNPDPEPGSGMGQLFSCNPSQVPKTPLLKLTNREYRNSINMALDDFNISLKTDTQLLTFLNAIPSDVITEDRNTLKEQSLLNSQPIFNASFEVAYRAAVLVSGHANGLRDYPGTSQCLSQATITQTCHQNFVREFARRAFRRPLTVAEANALSTSLFSSSLSKSEQIQTTVAAMFLMPEFGYKAFDQGSVSAVAANTREMTAHEVAAKISFLLTGGPPDSTLRGLADNGQILTAQVMSSEIDRLLSLPSARSSVVRLFRESFGYDFFDNFTYSDQFRAGINTSGLREAMTQELDDFFYDVVVTRRGTFRDLFTDTSTRINHSGLSAIYQVSNPATSLPNLRAGFLNRAAMLTKRSGPNASPIKRGLKVLEHVFCENVGLPPPSAPTSLPPSNEPMTTRDRTVASTEVSGGSCVSCHGAMNNLGYPFEHFDSLGRQRSTEPAYNLLGQLVASLPIETAASTQEITGRSVTVSDSVDLSERIGSSDRARMCFMQHLKRFESRVNVSSSANCHMNQGLTALYGQNGVSGTVVDAIKGFIMAPEFRRWSY
jgi:hypothetical protein